MTCLTISLSLSEREIVFWFIYKGNILECSWNAFTSHLNVESSLSLTVPTLIGFADQTHLDRYGSRQKQSPEDDQQGANQKEEYGQRNRLVRDLWRAFLELWSVRLLGNKQTQTEKGEAYQAATLRSISSDVVTEGFGTRPGSHSLGFIWDELPSVIKSFTDYWAPEHPCGRVRHQKQKVLFPNFTYYLSSTGNPLWTVVYCDCDFFNVNNFNSEMNK